MGISCTAARVAAPPRCLQKMLKKANYRLNDGNLGAFLSSLSFT